MAKFFWGVVLIVVAVLVILYILSLGSPGSAQPQTGGVNPQITQSSSPAISASWPTYTDTTSGESFRYPRSFGFEYMRTVDWPPHVQVVNSPYTCQPGGNGETARAGITDKETINGREYCVTKESNGAAGTTYTSYAYAFAHNGKTAILTFSFAFPNCANYADNTTMTACTREENTFNTNIGPTADAIAQSVHMQ